ncbi:MAG: hypothetical protein KA715_07905 [Xanthomonadaceae bacterium]|nr:hypothetical protein [Xanthomonadaceae bacterium]
MILKVIISVKGTCTLDEFRSLNQIDILWVSSHEIPINMVINDKGDTVCTYLLITSEPFKSCSEIPQSQCLQNRADIKR